MTGSEIQKILKKIKVEMATNGINQSALAKKLGLTHAAVSSWFNGRSTPNLEMLLKIFRVLNKPSNYFFENNGNIATEKSAINIHTPTESARLALIEKDIEIIKKDLEILKLKIK